MEILDNIINSAIKERPKYMRKNKLEIKTKCGKYDYDKITRN